MLGLSELKRTAAKEGVPQGTIEKDYVLSVALNAVAESEISKYLAFKGGTAIKKVYFQEARFSEDLDFAVLSGLTKEDILRKLNETLGDKEIEGIRFGKFGEEKTSAGLKASVKFTGPLMHEQRVRFDFSFRENLVREPTRKTLIDSYKLGSHEVLVLRLEEIFAEKIHALGSRAAPRDLYDVWFLLKKGVLLDMELLEKKFAYYGEKFEKDKIEANVRQMEESWKRDLERLVKDLPEFEIVAQEVKERIQQPRP